MPAPRKQRRKAPAQRRRVAEALPQSRPPLERMMRLHGLFAAGRFPNARSLQEKAAATGVPVRYLKESYDRGMAAWRTGHRPGATQEQWGYARVHSLLLCGKTYRTTDSDIARRASQTSKSARAWFTKTC